MISCSHWGMFEVPVPSYAYGTEWWLSDSRVMAGEPSYDSKYLHG